MIQISSKSLSWRLGPNSFCVFIISKVFDGAFKNFFRCCKNAQFHFMAFAPIRADANFFAIKRHLAFTLAIFVKKWAQKRNIGTWIGSDDTNTFIINPICVASLEETQPTSIAYFSSNFAIVNEASVIQEWYRGFMSDCPDGRLTPKSFMHIYSKCFPTGNANEFCDHVTSLTSFLRHWR